MTLKQMLFGFDGRIRRRDWWLWSIATGLIYAAVVVTVNGLIFQSFAMDPVFDGNLVGPFALSVVLYLPLLWVQLALAAKRAHDRSHGAALVIVGQVIAAAATYVPGGSLVPGNGSVDLLAVGVQGLAVVINLALFVLLGCLDGTQGPNRFGRSPKGVGGDPAGPTAAVFD